MLNRRFLRVKVLQELYAYHQAQETNLAQAERQLLKDIDGLYELFIYMLSCWVEVKRFAEQRIDENKHKIFATEEDQNPNLKFVNNRILNTLENNKQFQILEDTYKINWGDDRDDFIRSFYGRLQGYPEYQEYMTSGKDSFTDDKQFLVSIVDNHMADDDLLYDYFADKNLCFNSDYQIALYLLWKFFNDLRPDFNADSRMPSVYVTDNKEVNEDRDFAVNLFRKTILHREEFKEWVEGIASNWDYGRLALMDKILIFMALTEFCDFHSIPVKVTINEYVEIAKFFSTAESSRFVNGILDKSSKMLAQNGRMVKTGLGLIDK